MLFGFCCLLYLLFFYFLYVIELNSHKITNSKEGGSLMKKFVTTLFVALNICCLILAQQTGPLINSTSPEKINKPLHEYSGGNNIPANIESGNSSWGKLTGVVQTPIPEKVSKGIAALEHYSGEWGRIILTDAAGKNYTLYAVTTQVNLNKYELPPPPPAGAFDIRFGSGTSAEEISTAKSIELSGVVYPIKIKVENMQIKFIDIFSEEIIKELQPGEELIIQDNLLNKLIVQSIQFIKPVSYALDQNFPNPFNPSTLIAFSLPEDVANAKLTIYNALGERVAELVNEALTAGKYQYQWNAQSIATGMYIYELRTDNFVSVKKMLLLK